MTPRSVNFPGNNGLYPAHIDNSTQPQEIINSASDVFVSKFNAAGTLLFSVYLGANNFLGDSGNGIAVDATGKIYITGYSHVGGIPSTNFPVTNTFTYSRGFIDVFVSVLSNDGSQLLYSTLLGGGGTDYGNAIALDPAGDIYVTGMTYSDTTTTSSFPVKNAAFTSGDNLSSLADAFIFKLSPNGAGNSDLIYSTYLGGSKQDEGQGIVVDSSGDAIITGLTSSQDFAGQSGLQGFSDAFVARLNATGDTLLYAAHLHYLLPSVLGFYFFDIFCEL